MITSPIALFVYNRPDHTRRTIEALKQNNLAEVSDLIVFSDAPKSKAQAEAVQGVRRYISEIDGFKSVSIVERDGNFGLARSIIDGVTTIVNNYGRIIVLEDDMVTSPYFLTYMNEALKKYANDERVISIHGYAYPVNKPLPEAFFLRGADCWGWGTWARGWKIFNNDGQYLLDELKRKKLTFDFDFNGTYPFTKMLADQIEGKNNSWAVRWYASAFLAEKLTLYPGCSLVKNIGFDGGGTHCDMTTVWDSSLSVTPISLSEIIVEASPYAWKEFQNHFRSAKVNRIWKLHQKVKKITNFLLGARR